MWKIEEIDKYILIYGDILIDKVATDSSNTKFHKFLGGATVNVAVGIRRLGVPAQLITVFGQDEDSTFAKKELANEMVSLTYAQTSLNKRIINVYVHLLENGDREFFKYEDATPTIQVDKDCLNEKAFQHASIFHFSSGTMFQANALETTKKAIEMAKAANTLISLDANIRPLRWESKEMCRSTILTFLDKVDILKVTEEELFFITDTENRSDALQQLAPFEIPLLLITVGSEGSYAVVNGENYYVSSINVDAVDTTGAGDAFMAAVLTHIYKNGLPNNSDSIVKCLSLGNKVGALATTKRGAITGLPFITDLI